MGLYLGMKAGIGVVASLLYFGAAVGSGKAEGVNLEEFGHPAVISFHSDRATLITNGAERILTLEGPSKLATISARVHVHNERFFEAFPIGELPEAWNSCNSMKLQNGWFHIDGINSVLTFDSGPSGHGHLSTAPLITNTKTIEKISGDGEGVLYLMLSEAAHSSGRISFKVEGDAEDGEYLNLEISTECLRNF